MLKFFYQLPISYVIAGTILVLVSWSIAIYKYSYRNCYNSAKTNRNWLLFRSLFLIFSIFVVLTATVLTRNTNEVTKLVLQPLYSFAVAKIQPEMYRSMLMNVILFIPLGMSIVSLLSTKCNVAIRILVTSLLGVLLSTLIESAQYFFGLGEAWTDDVICNALGALCGSLTICIWKILLLRKHDYT